MSHTHVRTQLLTTVVLILPLSGCAGPRELLPPGEQIIEVGTPAQFLSCAQPGLAARPDTQVVGAAGGMLRSGNVELTIPAGALPDERRFVLRRDSGQAARATVEGEGPVQFQNNLSARLTFDLSGCDQGEIEQQSWWVWRLNRVEGRSQKLRTVINPNRAMAAIDSTSVFLIAN